MITPVARSGNSAPTRLRVGHVRNKFEDANRRAALIIITAADDLGSENALAKDVRAEHSGSFTDMNPSAIIYKIVSAQQVRITTNGTSSLVTPSVHLDTAGLIGATSTSATPGSVVLSGVTGSGHQENR